VCWGCWFWLNGVSECGGVGGILMATGKDFVCGHCQARLLAEAAGRLGMGIGVILGEEVLLHWSCGKYRYEHC